MSITHPAGTLATLLFELWKALFEDSPDKEEPHSVKAPLLRAVDEAEEGDEVEEGDKAQEDLSSPMASRKDIKPSRLPRGVRLLLLTFTAAVALLFFSTRFSTTSTSLSGASSSCRSPRLISHRGFDADVASAPAADSVASLLDSGVSSFDVDLFWLSSTAPGSSPLFIGHPPSTRSLWQLPQELPDTPLEHVRTSEHGHQLFPLEDFLSVLRSRSAHAKQTTLELKFPDRPEWPTHLKRMYNEIAASGIANQLGAVVESKAGAAAHRAAQSAAGTRVELFFLQRDLGAEKDGKGEPHLNTTTLSVVRITYYLLLTTYYLILTPHYLILTPYSLLLTLYSLPLSYHLLLTTYYLTGSGTCSKGPNLAFALGGRWLKNAMCTSCRPTCAHGMTRMGS